MFSLAWRSLLFPDPYPLERWLLRIFTFGHFSSIQTDPDMAPGFKHNNKAAIYDLLEDLGQHKAIITQWDKSYDGEVQRTYWHKLCMKNGLEKVCVGGGF